MGGIGLILMAMAASYLTWLFIKGLLPRSFRECVAIVMIGLAMAILGAVLVLPYDFFDTLTFKGASSLQIAVVIPGYLVVSIGIMSVVKLLVVRTVSRTNLSRKKRA